MKACRRESFGKKEEHFCFNCGTKFKPAEAKTCPKCNFKIGVCGCCACNVSKETKDALDKFYDLFCEPHNYSKETKYALCSMLKCYYNHCKRCLE